MAHNVKEIDTPFITPTDNKAKCEDDVRTEMKDKESKDVANVAVGEEGLEEGELEDSDEENTPLEPASAPAKPFGPGTIAIQHRPKAMPIPFHATHRALDILSGHKLAPSRPQDMASTGNVVGSDLCTTAAHQLPGYSLRCRKVPFRENTPRKRKLRSYPSIPPQTKTAKLTDARSGSEREPSSSKEEEGSAEDSTRTQNELPSAMKSDETVTATDDRSSDSDGLHIADEGEEVSVERLPFSETHKREGETSHSTDIVSSVTLQGAVQPQGVGYGTSQSAQSQVMALSAASSSRHVLLTDRATGQVEELTPLSSPGDSLPSLGEGSPLQPPPLCPTNPPSGSGSSPSLLQQSLCVELRCPLRLPEWLVTGMVRVQTMAIHTPLTPDWRKKKKGERPWLNPSWQPPHTPSLLTSAPPNKAIIRALKQKPLTCKSRTCWSHPNKMVCVFLQMQESMLSGW